MTPIKSLAAALAFGLAPIAASADALVLNAPGTGASLHDGGIDLSVYYTADDAGTYTVVGTYVDGARSDAPARFVMSLDAGDEAHFSLPGRDGVIYGFERRGNAVAISSAAAPATILATRSDGRS